MSERSWTREFDAVGDICRDWWMDLAAIDPKTGDEKSVARPNRGELAKLRRIGIEQFATEDRVDVAAANLLWPYRKLRGELAKMKTAFFRSSSADDDFDQAVAVVAATLARVRRQSPKSANAKVATLLGLGKDGKAVKDDGDAAARVMAEARFKRLIRTRDWPDLLDQGRRIVHLLGRDVPVADLGASLLLWHASPAVIRRWSFAYYDADLASYAPDVPPSDAAA